MPQTSKPEHSKGALSMPTAGRLLIMDDSNEGFSNKLLSQNGSSKSPVETKVSNFIGSFGNGTTNYGVSKVNSGKVKRIQTQNYMVKKRTNSIASSTNSSMSAHKRQKAFLSHITQPLQRHRSKEPGSSNPTAQEVNIFTKNLRTSSSQYSQSSLQNAS